MSKGKKTEEKIKEGIAQLDTDKQRTKLLDARAIAEPLVNYLQAISGIKAIEVASSYRRCKETVGDLDIVATCKKGSSVMEQFLNHDEIDQVVSQGKTPLHRPHAEAPTPTMGQGKAFGV